MATSAAEGALPAEDGRRRMDRHHEPDRAALRHRPRAAAHQGGAAGRRQLPDHRHQDLHLRPASRTSPTNIIHLVLARIEGAPAGTKGISLFIVPKFIAQRRRHARRAATAVSCGSIEHKMGIHGNSTCVMNYDGATGWLVGEENRGLNAMFMMMNEARLGVGAAGAGAVRGRLSERRRPTRRTACRAAR